VLPYLAYVFLKHRREFLLFAAVSAIPVIIMLALNVWTYGSVFGAFSRLTSANEWGVDMPSFFGLLLSPSRGLFVYSPFLLFAFPGMYDALKARDSLKICFLSSIALNTLFFMVFRSFAWGGYTFGPRLMAETLPFFAVFLALSFERVKSSKVLWTLFILALVYSLFVELIGAFSFDGGWEIGGANRCTINECPGRLWSVGDSQIGYYLNNPRIHVYTWMLNLTKS